MLKANKKPMAFSEIMATIQKKKLIKTKSANFANGIRRTISTSGAIKRVARGTYRA
ncbi:MAG: HTH domain-containing protein [Desulfobacterales bacterium]|nr:HTH domain-containing protein [Desulfobacterales bacterium]